MQTITEWDLKNYIRGALYEALEERETAIGNLGEIDSPDKLIQVLSKYLPSDGTLCRIGYFDSTTMNKKLPFGDWTDNNRWDDVTQKMQSLDDPELNDYMQNNPQFRNRQALNAKGKPVKQADYPLSGRALVCFTEFSANLGKANDKWGQQGRDRVNASAEVLRNSNYPPEQFRSDWADKIGQYGQENPDFDPNNISPDDYNSIINFVPKSAPNGAGWHKMPGVSYGYEHEKTGTRALRLTVASGLSQSKKTTFYIASSDGNNVTEIPKDKYFTYLSIAKKQPKESVKQEQISDIKRSILAAQQAVTKYIFRNYNLNNIGYMSFTFTDEDGQKHEFVYIPSEIQMEGISNPNALVNAIKGITDQKRNS